AFGRGPKPGVPGAPALEADGSARVSAETLRCASGSRTSPRRRTRIPGPTPAGHARGAARAHTRRPRARPVSIRIGADESKRPGRGACRIVAVPWITEPG